jgi:hypothetical protein
MKRWTALLLLVCAAGVASAQQGSSRTSARPHGEEHETVGEMSQEVARVRFEKLGYSEVSAWTRNGDYLEAMAKKDGKTWHLRIHVRSGVREVSETQTR